MEYRAHFVRRDGDIAGTTTLVCDDDAEAIAQATQMVGGFGIELLSGDRVIERLEPKRGPKMAWT
jgi:predicted dinucleotide-binding enzyme